MSRHVKSEMALITAFVLATAAGVLAESHVRIVRLSYLSGPVQTDRATGQGLERAMLNIPITQGVRIVTGNDGLAEVRPLATPVPAQDGTPLRGSPRLQNLESVSITLEEVCTRPEPLHRVHY
jgi:hypothetical protein